MKKEGYNMEKYVCSICGYIYDEAEGIPGDGIAPGTKWDALADDWVCILCGASKDAFEKEGKPADTTEKKPVAVIETPVDTKEMSPLEISILCTNLANGCEKQYKAEEAALYSELADYFKASSAEAKDPEFKQLAELMEDDFESGFVNANAAATDAGDRGALRALVWSEKVTRMLQSLLARYEKEGEALLENTDVHVCTICGFTYIGDDVPEICPVCKVPNWKIEKVERG